MCPGEAGTYRQCQPLPSSNLLLNSYTRQLSSFHLSRPETSRTFTSIVPAPIPSSLIPLAATISGPAPSSSSSSTLHPVSPSPISIHICFSLVLLVPAPAQPTSPALATRRCTVVDVCLPLFMPLFVLPLRSGLLLLRDTKIYYRNCVLEGGEAVDECHRALNRTGVRSRRMRGA